MDQTVDALAMILAYMCVSHSSCKFLVILLTSFPGNS
jgi:hypothetical protein